MIAFVIVNVNGEEELKQSFLDMASNNAQVQNRGVELPYLNETIIFYFMFS
jgi:hypothetical protein